MTLAVNGRGHCRSEMGRATGTGTARGIAAPALIKLDHASAGRAGK